MTFDLGVLAEEVLGVLVVLGLSVLLDVDEKLGDDSIDGSNLFTMFIRSSSIPKVDMTLTDEFSGDVGTRMELLEELLRLGRIRSKFLTLLVMFSTIL